MPALRKNPRALDHFVILIEKIEPAVQAYQRLGFNVRPIARHLSIGGKGGALRGAQRPGEGRGGGGGFVGAVGERAKGGGLTRKLDDVPNRSHARPASCTALAWPAAKR